LLQALSPEAYADLAPVLKPVTLRLHQVLHPNGTSLDCIYFIERGLVSALRMRAPGKAVEIALVGAEGATGVAMILQDEAPPVKRVVQVAGEARQVGRAQLLALAETRPEITQVLLRYAAFGSLQIAQTGICNAHHTVEQRVARWLMQARVALGDDSLPVSHSALAQILGVRRASVTSSLGQLERNGAVRLGRSDVVISDPRKLDALACECASFIARQYKRLISRTDGAPEANSTAPRARGAAARF
jgi:CRP-like cAMP-binding protein